MEPSHLLMRLDVLMTPNLWPLRGLNMKNHKYNLDAQIGESSACATALLCGVKANFETVDLDIRGKFRNCTRSFLSRVESLTDWAQQEGFLVTDLFWISSAPRIKSLMRQISDAALRGR
ncbi:uncharacterized protein LOC124369711 [Homalodisca vitripennis]|uniref:uncharacterized protein LOC124369711 n=1 Tax=Homalodisca vitripennis TaxID=197043 RepID=UPI001EEA2072|nr:uncharacterized protein LOC124369711 [Homalodisca vitripennis]